MDLSKLSLVKVASASIGAEQFTITDRLLNTPIPGLSQITLIPVSGYPTKACRIGHGRIWDVYEAELWNPIPSTVRSTSVKAVKNRVNAATVEPRYELNQTDETTAESDRSFSSSESDTMLSTPRLTTRPAPTKLALKACCPRLAVSLGYGEDDETTMVQAIKQEASLYCGPLIQLQGRQVPRFHGLFKGQIFLDDPQRHTAVDINRDDVSNRSADVYFMLLDRAGGELCNDDDVQSLRSLSGDLKSVL